MEHKNSSSVWVAIIVSVLIATSGLSFGIIRNSNKDAIKEIKTQQKEHTVTITQLREDNIRLSIQLEEFNKQLNQLNKKVDILIERK